MFMRQERGVKEPILDRGRKRDSIGQHEEWEEGKEDSPTTTKT